MYTNTQYNIMCESFRRPRGTIMTELFNYTAQKMRLILGVLQCRRFSFVYTPFLELFYTHDCWRIKHEKLSSEFHRGGKNTFKNPEKDIVGQKGIRLFRRILYNAPLMAGAIYILTVYVFRTIYKYDHHTFIH